MNQEEVHDMNINKLLKQKYIEEYEIVNLYDLKQNTIPVIHVRLMRCLCHHHTFLSLTYHLLIDTSQIMYH